MPPPARKPTEAADGAGTQHFTTPIRNVARERLLAALPRAAACAAPGNRWRAERRAYAQFAREAAPLIAPCCRRSEPREFAIAAYTLLRCWRHRRQYDA